MADAGHQSRAPSTSRPSTACTRVTVAKVRTSITRPSTAMAPNWPSSLRSKMHHRHHLGVRREEDDGGGELADHADEDEAPRGDDAAPRQGGGDVAEHAEAAGAEDAAGVLELRRNAAKRRVGLRVAHRHLLGQVGDEENPERAVEHERRAGVGDEEGDGEHHARNHHRRPARERRPPGGRATSCRLGDVGEERDQPRADGGGEQAQLEGVDDGGLGGAVLEEREGEVAEGEVLPRQRLGPRAREGGLGEDAVGQEDRARHHGETGGERGIAPAARARSSAAARPCRPPPRSRAARGGSSAGRAAARWRGAAAPRRRPPSPPWAGTGTSTRSGW